MVSLQDAQQLVESTIIIPLGLPSWMTWVFLIVLTLALVNFVTRLLDSGPYVVEFTPHIQCDAWFPTPDM